MTDRGIRKRTARSRPRVIPKAPLASDGEQAGTPQTAQVAETQSRTPGHGEHHRMIARNLNGLLENLNELRGESISQHKDLKLELRQLDAKVFRMQGEVEKLARSNANFMEEMTSVSFDTNLELRATRNHVEEIWKAMAGIAGSKKEIVEKHRTEVEEREKLRVAEIDRKLRDLAESARKLRKDEENEKTETST